MAVGTIADGLQIARNDGPDLVLLDVMLPDGSGFDALRELRSKGSTPVIMLTARSDEADRVAGLELGADDYVIKPFSARELVARIRAVLRRASAAADPAGRDAVRIGALELDPAARIVTLDREPLELTRKEFDLLALLMGHAGSVVTRERIMDEVWDENWFGSTKTLDVHIAWLRKKLGDDPAAPRYIHTVRGVGFRFAQANRADGRRPMSLRVRMLGAFGYVLVVTLVALEIPLTLNFSRRVDSEIRSEASAAAHAISAAASGRLTTRPALATLASDQAKRLNGRVLVVDQRGRVLVDSDDSAAPGSSYASRPEIASALRGTETQGERNSSSLRTDLLFTSVPIVANGHTTGAVRVTQSVEGVHHQVRKDVLGLLGLGAAVLLLGLGLAWALAGSLSRPLQNLAKAARRVAGGDMQARATPTGSSEQVEVANAFNDMTERLGRTLDAQRDSVANARTSCARR